MPDFDYHLLDEIIHSRIRLAILSILIGMDQAEFRFLKDQVKATDGNLSIHLRKLEEAGYITTTKSFLNRKPVSSYRMTPKGRQAFEKYVERIQKLIR
ncbi:transcriptional regulator [bacterium]|nr:transcriptional regulator [bacterium]